ncbi:MAG: HD domain-containing protein [Candidatus Omnitrophica bacterium]|nr:HD domain-containing protein [Candidatus Omnitrophota bacterium]
MNLSSKLKKIPKVSVLSVICKKRSVNLWLVGGFLRDVYLKVDKPLLDFDFCVEKNTTAVAREFARKIKAKCIVLDKAHESLRVILKKKSVYYTYDFTRLRGKDFLEDLALRDFSVNTLAVKLGQKPLELVDYYQGKRDLNSKIARVIREKVIADDPLRILRGFFLMANYNFRIEPRTLMVMKKNKHLIKKVSSERVSEEFFKILGAKSSYKVIKLIDQFKIIDELIPEVTSMRGVRQGSYHHLPVWKHSLEALRQFELLIQKRLIKDKEIYRYLNEEIAYRRKRVQIIKLACLLHDVGKPQAKKRLNKKTIFHTHEKIGRDMVVKIGKRMRLSVREIEVLKKLIFWHLRPGYLADQMNPTKRAIYRFFRDTQNDGAAVIILSLSDWRATCGPLINPAKRKKHEKVMLGLIDGYFVENDKKPLPKLVDGYDIMRQFKLKPSILVGKILGKVHEDQALGKISTKQEAYRLAEKLIPKKAKKK